MDMYALRVTSYRSTAPSRSPTVGLHRERFTKKWQFMTVIQRLGGLLSKVGIHSNAYYAHFSGLATIGSIRGNRHNQLVAFTVHHKRWWRIVPSGCCSCLTFTGDVIGGLASRSVSVCHWPACLIHARPDRHCPGHPLNCEAKSNIQQRQPPTGNMNPGLK